jgi:D-alanyl-D-alanine endopeptidase (penicillin-binding protein 7)
LLANFFNFATLQDNSLSAKVRESQMVKSARSLFITIFFLHFGIAQALAADESSTEDAPAKNLASSASTPKHRARHHALAHGSASVAHEKSIRRVSYVHGHRHVVVQRVMYTPSVNAVPSVGDQEGLNRTRDALDLKSNVALVFDQSNSQVLLDKNAEVALPIASITKLMTALVVVEAKQDMTEMLEITDEDIDREKNSSSRLRPGVRMSRGDMLHIALMSSENRAASALGRNYPGGLAAAVAAMNAKAKLLGMNDTHYVEPTGLSSQNVASARDLAKLVAAAQQESLLCQYSTDPRYVVAAGGRELQYANSNHLVSNPTWDILLQKTGYITEAGHCMVMRAMIEGRAIIMVFLDSKGKDSRLADAGRIRKWLGDVKMTTASRLTAAQQAAM